jgi:hypothetical protein
MCLSTFSVLVSSTIQAEATGDPDQVEDTQQLPRGFFDEIHDGAYVSRHHLNRLILVSDIYALN